MPRTAFRPNVLSISLAVAFAAAGALVWRATEMVVPSVLVVGLGLLIARSPRVAQQWERAVVLRLGRFVGLRGPGLFWIVPVIDEVSSWIDQRTITTSFAAEQTLTSDTVPVNVDAVLFWMVYDPEKAALEVQDYGQAVSWAAQTALRDIIGRTPLTELLRGREQIEAELQKLIDSRSNPWGVTVQSVEMRDVVIPESLQDAMSREAQAAREKQARIILGQAEVEIAHLVRRGREVLREQPDRPAPAGDEHPLRRAEGEGRPDARAQHRRRVDGPGRPARRGGAAPAVAGHRRRSRYPQRGSQNMSAERGPRTRRSLPRRSPSG